MSGIIEMVVGMIIFFIIVALCCGLDSGDTSTSQNRTPRKTNTYNRNSYSSCSYSECPSCGAPYYDGYCEECGYPDINQGWLGENY